jgi:hypothetical protein
MYLNWLIPYVFVVDTPAAAMPQLAPRPESTAQSNLPNYACFNRQPANKFEFGHFQCSGLIFSMLAQSPHRWIACEYMTVTQTQTCRLFGEFSAGFLATHKKEHLFVLK